MEDDTVGPIWIVVPNFIKMVYQAKVKPNDILYLEFIEQEDQEGGTLGLAQFEHQK